MDEAGKITVKSKLVDSYFGNISYLIDDIIYISQTGSSLDELDGYIDPCPIDNSSCAGITASIELSAHKQIYLDTENRAILHGHPKFSVILSMDCDQRDICKYKDQCHIKCPYKRFVNDIPIVPGEVGTGPYGLYKTMPPAIKGKRGVIVYGHGVFTACKKILMKHLKTYSLLKRCVNKSILKGFFNSTFTIGIFILKAILFCIWLY